MSEQEAASQETHTQIDVLTALKHVGTQSPTITGYFLDLYAHHAESARHSLRVSMTCIDTALALGLNPQFGAACALGHDTGKRYVPKDILMIVERDDERLSQMTGPHMKYARELIGPIPDSEFAPFTTRDGISVIMSHHEVLSHRGYPRNRQSEGLKEDQRQGARDPIKTWQILLAFSDKADRICHSLTGMERRPIDTIRRSLQERSQHVLYPIPRYEMDLYIEHIAKATHDLKDSTIEQGLEVLRESRHPEKTL